MNDLISIIVPVYNAEKYLAQCLQSICDQTYKNLQIIVVDDCSTDNSGKIIEKFAAEDTRIEAYRPDKNGGQSASRNLGLKHAKGNWIGFVDNDDTIEPKMYETLLKGAIDNNVVVSGCANKRIEDGHTQICNLGGRPSGIYKTHDIVKNILINPNNTWIEVWTKIYHKSLIERLKFPVGCQLEDYKVNLPLLFDIKEIYFTNKAFYNWNVNSLSQSKQTFFDNRLSYIQVTNEIVRWFEDQKASQDILSASYMWRLCVQSSLLEQMCDSRDRKYIKLAKQYLPQVKSLYKDALSCSQFKFKTKIHVKLRFLKVQFA